MNNIKKTIVELKGVYKIYKMGEIDVNALNNVDLKILENDFVSITGTSGSGKSTMMHIIGALDLPTKGKVYIDNIELSKLTENEISKIRGKKIGFIFQEFNLIPTLNALENVRLPMLFQDTNIDKDKRCIELLKKVGLEKRIYHKPTELSGGEQQRVAIARALSNNPEIILADEPTGALDSKSSKDIIDILSELNEQGRTIILITHNKNIAKFTKRNITIKDGKIIEDKIK